MIKQTQEKNILDWSE